MTTHQNNTFPSRTQLWLGAILATIAHGIWICSDPELDYELSWDGPNYNRQNTQGTYGTITFADDGVIGVFRDDNSPRAPWNATEQYSLSSRLIGMPQHLVDVAQREAFQYILDEYNGVTEPIITAAFWSDGDDITAAEAWVDVLLHGAHLVRVEAMETAAAIEEWQDSMEFSPEQVMLLTQLFEHKMINFNQPLVIDDVQFHQLVANGDDGIVETRELFAVIGIVIPD